MFLCENLCIDLSVDIFCTDFLKRKEKLLKMLNKPVELSSRSF